MFLTYVRSLHCLVAKCTMCERRAQVITLIVWSRVRRKVRRNAVGRDAQDGRWRHGSCWRETAAGERMASPTPRRPEIGWRWCSNLLWSSWILNVTIGDGGRDASAFGSKGPGIRPEISVLSECNRKRSEWA